MKQKEILENLTGQKMPEPGEPLVIKEQIPGTPFWAIGQETGWHLVMGKYRITKEPLNSYQEILQYLEKHHWDITLSITIAIASDILNNKNQN